MCKYLLYFITWFAVVCEPNWIGIVTCGDCGDWWFDSITDIIDPLKLEIVFAIVGYIVEQTILIVNIFGYVVGLLIDIVVT